MGFEVCGLTHVIGQLVLHALGVQAKAVIHLEFRIKGSKFRVEGLGFRVKGLRFSV